MKMSYYLCTALRNEGNTNHKKQTKLRKNKKKYFFFKKNLVNKKKVVPLQSEIKSDSKKQKSVS